MRSDPEAPAAVLVWRERRDRESREAILDPPDERTARVLPDRVAAVGSREDRAGAVIPGARLDGQGHGANRGAVEIRVNRATDPLPGGQVRRRCRRLLANRPGAENDAKSYGRQPWKEQAPGSALQKPL